MSLLDRIWDWLTGGHGEPPELPGGDLGDFEDLFEEGEEGEEESEEEAETEADEIDELLAEAEEDGWSPAHLAEELSDLGYVPSDTIEELVARYSEEREPEEWSEIGAGEWEDVLSQEDIDNYGDVILSDGPGRLEHDPGDYDSRLSFADIESCLNYGQDGDEWRGIDCDWIIVPEDGMFTVYVNGDSDRVTVYA